MLDLWVMASVAAAAFQTLRFLLQKRLSMGALSTGGATFSRFLYSAPIVSLLALAYVLAKPGDMGGLGDAFWPAAMVGGITQVLATWTVVAMFQRRNFAVGIAFKKTEVLQTALVGFLVLGDRLALLAVAAMALGLVGVWLLSPSPGQDHAGRRPFDSSAALGLLSGLLFAVSAVSYRAATLEVVSDDPLMRALVTLALVTVVQTALMLLWLRWREAGEIGRVLAAWRTAIWIGLSGMAGSLCWFLAFTLANAALVFAVGQVELIFSLAVGALMFREKVSRRELIGIGAVATSVVVLTLLT